MLSPSVYVLLFLLAGFSSGCDSSSSSGFSSTSLSSSSSPTSSPSASSEPAAATTVILNSHILVDQFGYRPADPKVAVVRNPQTGYDAADTFVPGSTYQVREASNGTVAFFGSPIPWNNGTVQTSSGDSGWWFDFSNLTTPGTYFIYDVSGQVRSPTFNVGQQVYKDVLKAAVRMYFYQRAGTGDGGGSKQPPYVDKCWADNSAYIGPGQDTEAHDVTDRNNSAKVHDLSGGWFDAGDTNKYVTFATPVVHQLLSAYQENPAVFTDDFNIPESGNGIPDVIDEVKYETDWLKRMQFSSDGSVALKVGVLGDPSGLPSSDTSPRFYVPSCTSSTIAAAGMFAHASYVYATIPQLASEADELKSRAISAWDNFQSIPTPQENCDTGVVRAGDADWDAPTQLNEAVVAAVWLYAITSNTTYSTFVKDNYKKTRPYNDIGWTRYESQQGKALLFYTTLPNADATLNSTFAADKLSDVQAGNQMYGLTATDDLYRNFMHDPQYHWGSNQVRANYGNTNADVVRYGIAVSDTAPYTTRALETLHYFHGVNPFGMVYLSNMGSYGATTSVNEIYHAWYWPGTKWADAKTSECGPAPGYVPGGPNAATGGIPSSLTPPVDQPLQKSYRDWNGVVGDPQTSWEISEPGIYYQSAYVELLSQFAN